MIEGPKLDSERKAELHNRLANRFVAEILDEPIAAGGSMSDVLLLLESVLVGVVGDAFPPDSTGLALHAILGRAEERLARLQRIN